MVEILDTNAAAVSLFFDVQTQWLSAGMGGLIGLNYVAVESVLNIRRTKRSERSELFDRLKIIESAVLAEWARQRKTKRKP